MLLEETKTLLFFGTLKIVKFQEKWMLRMSQETYNMRCEIILNDALLSPLLNPLEGSTMCSCEKLGLGGRSQLPTL